MLNSAPLCCMFFHQQQYFDWQVCSKPIYPVSWYHPCKLTAVLHETTLELQKKAQIVKSKRQTSLKVLYPHRLSVWSRPASCGRWSTILWESNIDLLPQASKHQTSYLSPKPNFQRQSVWLVFRPPQCPVHSSVQLTVLVSCLCW